MEVYLLLNCQDTRNLKKEKFEKGLDYATTDEGAEKCKKKCVELRDGLTNPCLGYTFTSSGNCYLKSIDALVKLCPIKTDSISARVNQGLNRFYNV